MTQLAPDTRGFEYGDLIYFAVRSGVASWDKAQRKLEIIPLDAGLGTAEIRSMEKVKDKIWVVTRSAGVYVFDPSTRKIVEHFMVGEPLDDENKFGYNGNMQVDRDDFGDALWFGHFVNVDRYDLRTGKWKSLNADIKAAGIGRPGSAPRANIRKEGVWITHQKWRDGNGQTLFCDHAAAHCELAKTPLPPEPVTANYKGCAASGRFEIAVCGDEVVKKTTSGWDVLFKNEVPFEYPINIVDASNPVGPFITCYGDNALIVANGGMQILNFKTMSMTAVKGGEGFVLDGFWGTQSEGDRLQITKDYDGCDTVPPSQYYSFSFATNELEKKTSGGFAGRMKKQGPVCDLPDNMRVEATNAGLKIGKLAGDTLQQQADKKAAQEKFDAQCAVDWRLKERVLPAVRKLRFIEEMNEKNQALPVEAAYPGLYFQAIYGAGLFQELGAPAIFVEGPVSDALKALVAKRPAISSYAPEPLRARHMKLLDKISAIDRANPSARKLGRYGGYDFERLLFEQGWESAWKNYPVLPPELRFTEPACRFRGTAPDVQERVKFQAEMELSMRVSLTMDLDSLLADLDRIKSLPAEQRYEALWIARANLSNVMARVLEPSDRQLFPKETNAAVLKTLDSDPQYERFRPAKLQELLTTIDHELEAEKKVRRR
jgi:hypothetical protein